MIIYNGYWKQLIANLVAANVCLNFYKSAKKHRSQELSRLSVWKTEKKAVLLESLKPEWNIVCVCRICLADEETQVIFTIKPNELSS